MQSATQRTLNYRQQLSTKKSNNMAELKFKPGDIKLLKPTNILRTTKASFSKQDRPVNFQYYITMEDKAGDSVTCEFLSGEEPQDDFNLGVYQYIKVNFLSPHKGTPEIVPCEEPQKASNIQYNAHIQTPGNTSYVDIADTKDKPEPNCYSVPAHGKAITFAMGYAKDILVAELQGNPRKVTDDDIKRMTSWAEIINQAICDRINF